MHQILAEILERSRQLRAQQTPFELELWKYLRKRQLNGLRFLRQHPLKFFINNKVHYFIADFYCHERKLIVELDGGIHKNQKEYDAMRDTVIKEMKIQVLRFKNEEIFQDIEKVLEQIKNS